MANGAHPVADFHGEIWIFPGSHALQEIVMLARGIRVEMDFLRSNLRFQNLWRTRFDRPAPAGVPDPPFGPDELDAWISRLARHHHPIGVAKSKIVILDRIIEPARP